MMDETRPCFEGGPEGGDWFSIDSILLLRVTVQIHWATMEAYLPVPLPFVKKNPGHSGVQQTSSLHGFGNK
jgi:hypothetical protein